MTSNQPLDLDHLDALHAAATPGPWHLTDSSAIVAPLTADEIADVWEPTATSRNGEFIEAAREAIPALVAEVRRLRARVTELETAMEEIRHLHKDSPMGPCPVCIDADAAAAGGDGLVPYPCPTGRLAGAQDCEPPSFRAANCPGFEKEYQGVSDAKRRLANCKHCGAPRTAHPAARSAAV